MSEEKPSRQNKQAQQQKSRKAPLFELPLDEDQGRRGWREGSLFGETEGSRPRSGRPAPKKRPSPDQPARDRRVLNSDEDRPPQIPKPRVPQQSPQRHRVLREEDDDDDTLLTLPDDGRHRRDYRETPPRQRLLDRPERPGNVPYDRGDRRSLFAQRKDPYGHTDIGGDEVNEVDSVFGRTSLVPPIRFDRSPYPSPPLIVEFLRDHPAVIAIVSLLIILLLWPGNSPSIISSWTDAVFTTTARVVEAIPNPFASSPNPPGDYRLQGAPSVTAQQIDDILASYNSPAQGSGEVWMRLGREYGIDPAFALAFFIHESSAGTHPNWAGHKPDGTTTHNIGNIICAGYSRCHGRFRDYTSWEEGIGDWYRLIAREYIDGRGTETVDDIIPIYAPSVENDVQGYINAIKRMVDDWRGTNVWGADTSDRPNGSPLNAPNAVMTQGYGIGSHAPAHVWGAIDLAIDGNGDGVADPSGTWDRPVFATHSGMIKVSPNTWPAGNHVWIINQEYKTGYAHLSRFAVADGQMVERGTAIGYIGSTGQSSGPHLDYQVWHLQNGTWVNVNPLDYGALNSLQ